MKRLLPLCMVLLLNACSNNDGNKNDDTGGDTPPPTASTGIPAPAPIQVAMLAEYPHDTAAFTEGLLIHDGKLYEGTGQLGTSYIQISDIKTGRVEQKHLVKDNTIFGEGINIINGKLYQLTWENHIVYVYDLKDLSKPIKTFPWQTQGWGMTNNGKELIISDGQASGNLYFVNPEDFRINRVLQVSDNYGPVTNINELEYIDGYVFANVWGTTYIIKIDPNNGHVVGKIETADILKSFYSSYRIEQMDNVLNGIAYDSSSKKIYVTGKNWPKLFELRLN